MAEPKRAEELEPAALAAIVNDREGRLHFAGIAGSGMSALARHRALGGGRTSGSDRAFDRGELDEERAGLHALGIEIHLQDGSGVAGARAVVTSTAVESTVPELATARRLGIPVIHRADLLAHHVRARRSVAVAGTSGKSTVAAMIFEILEVAGLDPGLITGADLVRRREQGLPGNAAVGTGPLVVEADESDGSLVRHRPSVALVLNLHRDHVEPAAALELFATFASQARETVLAGDDPELLPLRRGARVFGFGPEAHDRGRDLQVDATGSTFVFEGVRVRCPIPGAHQARNALAAMAVARGLGVGPGIAAAALAGFRGTSRRFQVVGTAGGIEVIDDFAHNPTKIAATLAAAQLRAPRVLAFFQPHGFAPARFMRRELAHVLERTLRPGDPIWIGEIYYAGGTAAQDLGSADLVRDLLEHGLDARHLADRETWIAELRSLAREGDLVLVMGARDPGLAAFARRVLAGLGRGTRPSCEE